MFGIELVFYGENEAEYGNPIADNSSSLRDKSYHTMQNIDEMYLAGLPVKEIIEEHDLKLVDLMTFLPKMIIVLMIKLIFYKKCLYNIY